MHLMYQWQRCPLSGYDLSVAVLANPADSVYLAYILYPAVQHDRVAYGASLVTLFGARRYGLIDFRTVERALRTIEGDDIPHDLQIWLSEIPFLVVEAWRGNVSRPMVAA